MKKSYIFARRGVYDDSNSFVGTCNNLTLYGYSIQVPFNLYPLRVNISCAFFVLFTHVNKITVNENILQMESVQHTEMFPSRFSSTTRFCLSNTEVFVTQVQQ